MFSAIAMMAFSVGSMANNVAIEDDSIASIIDTQEEEVVAKKLDCDKIKTATYNAAVAQGAGHYQATYIAAGAWVSCESSNGLWN